ncbi:hypothetical protein [Bacteroides neonati]|uniref:hypothetical protein n=1 Tax=Bacteroides neonati TaxID=1347393 RepID=UPI0004B0F6EB|nr:hypothetical protein [Bacteroides neonati]
MKHILFFIMAASLFIGCSKEEPVTEPNQLKYEINSSVTINNIKYESFLFEGDYHIIAYNSLNQKKIYEIKEKAETYIEDLGYGETREYTPQGCYILGVVAKPEFTYILISLTSNLAHVPNKFILKTKGGVVYQTKYFNDVFIPQTHKFYPEKLIDWYKGYIAFYVSTRTSGNAFGVLDENFNEIYFNESSEFMVENIIKKRHILISEKKSIFVDSNKIFCADMSVNPNEIGNKEELWRTKYTEEDIKVNSIKYSLSSEYVLAEIDVTTKNGTNKKLNIKINSKTGAIE